MSGKLIPLHIEGVRDSIYAGFWPRFASLLLDGIILLPAYFLAQYINSLGKDMYFYTLLPTILLLLWYYVVLPKKYGGTPGKLAMGLRIIRMDGKFIGYREAMLRYAGEFLLVLFEAVLILVSISRADETTFEGLSWLTWDEHVKELSPNLFLSYTIAVNIWVYGELIILLTNTRKRALHDFIAGTVIIKRIYLDKIHAVMQKEQ